MTMGVWVGSGALPRLVRFRTHSEPFLIQKLSFWCKEFAYTKSQSSDRTIPKYARSSPTNTSSLDSRGLEKRFSRAVRQNWTLPCAHNYDSLSNVTNLRTLNLRVGAKPTKSKREPANLMPNGWTRQVQNQFCDAETTKFCFSYLEIFEYWLLSGFVTLFAQFWSILRTQWFWAFVERSGYNDLLLWQYFLPRNVSWRSGDHFGPVSVDNHRLSRNLTLSAPEPSLCPRIHQIC